MKKKRILVLTDHMPWGHRSIAKAIYKTLKEQEETGNFEVFYSEIKAETGIAGDAYVLAYRFFPGTNRIAHKLMSRKVVLDLINDASVMNLPRLKKEVEKIKPDLIISAYFYHSHSLGKWRKKTGKKFKLWTVVADPWTINPSSFVKDADLNLVYDEVGERVAAQYDVPKSKVMKTGWWTRPEMYTKYDRSKARKKLGFTDNRPVVFVGGGSLGTGAMTKILPSLMFTKRKVGVVFNTGTDKFAFNLVTEYEKLFRKLKRNDLVQIKNLGWIDNMAEVLAGCDIVFGKAGPNFLFDTVACEKPFVAITHIGGQEDGNIEIILKKGLGWVKEKNGSCGKFFLKYLENPEMYQKKYAKNIKEEAERNQHSFEKILEKIKEI